MTDDTTDSWTAVDAYVGGLLVPSTPGFDPADLPAIAVSPPQGQFLFVIARALRAQRILEIGTLGGYSTIWLGRALPADGRLITFEIDPHHAEVARANIDRAGLSDIVEVRQGPAIDLLPVLAEEHPEPFDLAFIDADKISNADYYEWAMNHSHVGSVIVIDNVIRAGAVADPADDRPDVVGVRRVHELIAADRRATATTIQTVGLKGYDGFTMVLVVGE
jgi:predicted O-methyltransferase YrrM